MVLRYVFRKVGCLKETLRKKWSMRDLWGHILVPEHQVAMITLRPDGTWASAALRPGYKCVITDASGTALRDPDAVILE